MFQLTVPCTDGEHTETVYNIDDFPYFRCLFLDVIRSHKNKSYIALPATFDIETSTVVPDDPSERPFSFCYHWQFCLNGYVCFGRTLESFVEFLYRLSHEMHLTEQRKLVIYVHNLSYEFSFLRSWLQFTHVFALDKRKPARAEAMDGKFEFRCSYILSNMTLKKLCQNCDGVIHSKLSGDEFNYDKIRTPETELSEMELAYCYNDVKGLEECMYYYLRTDTVKSIPMTSTGFVRRDVRAEMKTNRRNRENFEQTKVNAILFQLLHDAFRGGDTHGNIYHSNVTLFEVGSRDIASSYPFQLMTRYFPTGTFTKVSPDWLRKHKNIRKKYAYIFRVYLENFEYIGTCGNPYIAVSKLHNRKSIVNDNGRALKGSGMLTVTDIDWYIISKEYKWDRMLIDGYIYISKYGELPKEFKDQLMKYYTGKTELKGLQEFIYEYMKSKNKLNSFYGMCVTNPCKPDILYDEDNGMFSDQKIPEGQSETQFMQDLLDKFYKSKNSFLPYQWGVWCTCWARLQMREMLWKIGRYNVYEDTDSIKFLEPEKIVPIFEAENEKLKELAIKYKAFAKDRKGNIKYMGQWEYDGSYTRFKTLGAKKYMVEYVPDDDEIKKLDPVSRKYYQDNGTILKLTVAGVNKKIGSQFFEKLGYNQAFEKFCNETKIEESGHLVAFYNDEMEIEEIEVNGCKILNGTNTALVNGSYTIGLTGEYLDLFEKAINNQSLIYLE